LKSTNWKDVAELIGVTAIVASLAFVGLQMNQSQKLAFAESAMAMRANSLEEANLLTGNIDIWLKGNAGEPLDTNEYEVYKILFAQRRSGTFFTWLALESIETQFEGVATQGMARFLFRNPGALAEWKKGKVEVEEIRVRSAAGPFGEFAGEVDAILTELDNKFGRNSK